MDYKQTIVVGLVAGGLAAGGGYAGNHVMKSDNPTQELKTEVVVRVDETKLASAISDNLIRHNKEEQSYQEQLARRKGCYRNRDNEHYLNRNCQGIDIDG